MQRRSAGRLRLGLTALGLLLGVLAMHAVGGGPHALAGADHAMEAAGTQAAAGQPAAMPSDGAATGMVDEAMQVLQAPAALAAELGQVAVLLPRKLPVDASGAMAAMCVVMLLSLVVALGYGVVGRARRRIDVALAPRPVGRSGRPLRAPPPDLLTQLCVLRT